MKTHAFVRSNVPVILAGKRKTEQDELGQSQQFSPTFQQYVYFLFAPTLVYRNYYPRYNFLNALH